MRKSLKAKRRSCSLCKPYKMAWENRWKPRDRMLLREFERDWS